MDPGRYLSQLIAGIIQPTEGEVILNGRLAAIFELGSGFNKNFTGRENITLYISMVGFGYLFEQKKIESEILDFAEIGEFIDQPLCTYSSGMIARLGFPSGRSWILIFLYWMKCWQ